MTQRRRNLHQNVAKRSGLTLSASSSSLLYIFLFFLASLVFSFFFYIPKVSVVFLSSLFPTFPVTMSRPSHPFTPYSPFLIQFHNTTVSLAPSRGSSFYSGLFIKTSFHQSSSYTVFSSFLLYSILVLSPFLPPHSFLLNPQSVFILCPPLIPGLLPFPSLL